MEVNSRAEILAPVGSEESLTAALQAGADAIYLGVGKLNMRSGTRNNFTPEDLPVITARCRERGVKVYLTLNTILFDEDMSRMNSLVASAARSGVDAVIASDPFVMQTARLAGLAVHISTQCNITNIESVRFYSQWADVMVLARELSLKQVAEISRQIEEQKICGPAGKPVRLEVFVHGALCMAVSGKCYLSLHSQNASANRGACLQNCRRPYVVTDKQSGTELEVENEYIMSAKDLCTIRFLDQILAAGASLLKIEGRGRSADYVEATVRCYREAVTAVDKGEFTLDKILKWEEDLSEVYNRGFWDGYYLGQKMGEWNDVHGSKATVKKVYLGPAKTWYAKPKAGVFQLQSGELKSGDKIMISGPTTGVIKTVAGEMRLEDHPVDSVQKGDLFSMKIEKKVRASDKLYKLVDV
ncbi:MAG: U32 family peptidase [Balneolaceae bacterium]|nr:MAG: U32 family peptidase [Balneolaceae bacterium]